MTNKKVQKKIERTSENYFSTTEVVILVIMTVVVSFVVGFLTSNNLNKGKKYNYDKYLKRFTKNYDYVLDNYYKKVDKDKLINGAIKGMVNSLGDGYSYAIDEESSDNFNIQLEGQYKGIGVEIVNTDDDQVVIYGVFENSPADKAGLKAGDILKKVDDMDCEKVKTSEISKYIRNSNNNSFKLIIERKGEKKDITINKEAVIIKSVKSKTFDKNDKKIGYLYISIFSNSTVKQFREELEKLEKEKIDALIIDVRDNSGGHLTTATGIISLFLDSDHIMYQTNTKGKIKKFYSNGKETKKYPIAVLQNGNSASASEMLSAALKEEYNAIIIGEKSYGKGTVQELLDINGQVEYKITTKLWLTPKGNSINKKGVKPDVEVKLDKEYLENPSDEKDNQLQKALDEISKK